MCILEINLNVFSNGPVCGKEKMAEYQDFMGYALEFVLILRTRRH